jgi:hypothetical protein
MLGRVKHKIADLRARPVLAISTSLKDAILPIISQISHIRPMARKPKTGLAEVSAGPYQVAANSTMLLPIMASHPIVSGAMPMFMPHRPEKSEGGIRFQSIRIPFRYL